LADIAHHLSVLNNRERTSLNSHLIRSSSSFPSLPLPLPLPSLPYPSLHYSLSPLARGVSDDATSVSHNCFPVDSAAESPFFPNTKGGSERLQSSSRERSGSASSSLPNARFLPAADVRQKRDILRNGFHDLMALIVGESAKRRTFLAAGRVF